jgi:hypothetical protein
MSGSHSSNDAAVQFEEQQAAEADAKEAARQARLEQGKKAIDAIFSGQPVMKDVTSNYDWGKFDPDIINMQNTWRLSKGGTGAGTVVNASDPTQYGLPSNYKIQGNTVVDPSGKVYKKGENMPVTTQVDTGERTGGFNDAYYNAYKQKYLDYYNADETRQYNMAKRDLNFKLADQGILESSAATDKEGELAYQDTMNKKAIVDQANAATSDLQTQIQNEKSSLINQLYATEDPTLTANMAQTAATGFQLKDPTLTPAGALFTPVLSGVSSAASSYLSPIVPYSSPYGAGAASGGSGVASAGTASDKRYV